MEQHYVLVGSIDAGKTSLFNALNGNYSDEAVKTQAIEFDQQGGVDTPGEFFNHPNLYRALISTTTEAETIIYVHAADDKACQLPAGLLDVYHNKQIITVITKIDLPNIDLPEIKKMLKNHGLNEPFFEVSIYKPETVQALALFLEKTPHLKGNNNE